MKVWHGISEFKAVKPVLTIGSFDGVHLGHMEVIRQLKSMAYLAQGQSVIFTFHPHPASVLAPHKKLDYLNTIEEKTILFEKAGIDHLIVFPFTKEFSSVIYQEFVTDILIKKLNIHTLLVGHDNTIGKNREGNFDELMKLSEVHKFNVYTHTELKVDEERVNSTIIRQLLNEGRLLDASKLLGYFYSVSGIVVKGKQLGNKLGFPTANILPDKKKFVPAIGVYTVLVTYMQKQYKGMMNIGIRPTVDDDTTQPVLEVNIFDFAQSIYGENISISILRKIRNEYKFESIEALRHQIIKDKETAQEIFQKEFDID